MVTTRTKIREMIDSVKYVGRYHVFEVPSETDPERKHILVLRKDGSICSCDGFQIAGKCWHTNLDDLIARLKP